MIEKFVKFISKYSPINQEETEYIEKNIPLKRFSKNEVFFREGSISKAIYFILEGCVRLFYNADGKDKTAYFYTEGKFLCANESFINKTPARENFQALENTTLMVFTEANLIDLLKNYSNFENVERFAILDELVTSNRLIESFTTQSPEERYIELLDSNRELFQRVPQQYIATYLGVSPESLSRIRKRISQKSNERS